MKKIFNIHFILLLAINAAMYLAIMTVNVLVSKYAAVFTDNSVLIGASVSAMAVTCLALKLVAAPVLTRFNKRNILSGALFIMGISFIGIGMSSNVISILFFRGLQGVGLAFSSTCFLTLAADALPDEKLSSGIGYFSLAQALAQAVGPSIGLALIGGIGYRYTFLLAASLLILACVLTFVCIRTASETLKGGFHLSFDQIIAKEALVPAFLMFLITMVFYVINTFLILFAEERNVDGIGLFFTVYSITILFSRPFIGQIADKIGNFKVFVPSLICFAVSFVIISMSHQLWMFLIAAVLQTFGYGVATPLLQAVIMKSVPKERRCVASCTGYVGTDLGTLAGPMAGGMLADHMGYTAMWNMMIIPLAVAALTAVIFRKKM